MNGLEVYRFMREDKLPFADLAQLLQLDVTFLRACIRGPYDDVPNWLKYAIEGLHAAIKDGRGHEVGMTEEPPVVPFNAEAARDLSVNAAQAMYETVLEDVFTTIKKRCDQGFSTATIDLVEVSATAILRVHERLKAEGYTAFVKLTGNYDNYIIEVNWLVNTNEPILPPEITI